MTRPRELAQTMSGLSHRPQVEHQSAALDTATTQDSLMIGALNTRDIGIRSYAVAANAPQKEHRDGWPSRTRRLLRGHDRANGAEQAALAQMAERRTRNA